MSLQVAEITCLLADHLICLPLFHINVQATLWCIVFGLREE